MSARHLARLGKNIGRLRSVQVPAAISQRELAALAGLSPATVSQIERGKHEPRLGTLVALSGALGLGSIEELTGPMPSAAFRGKPKPR